MVQLKKIKALVIAINFNRDPDYKELVAEGVSLVESAGYEVILLTELSRPKVDPKFFVGSGKLEELKISCATLNIDTVIFIQNLSSVQERNLEKEFKLPVIDRTRLILDIFASRVTTNEGILQVELATLSHQMTRLVKRWSHLERQRGGIGLRGGPGETQIELDRRMISEQIKRLKARLRSSVKQRETQRKARAKNNIFSISIVGYTNAGKSTLFNSLTKSNVYVENRLFATLQTTSRKLFLNENRDEVVISDTVGFIRDLPHTLVAAFRATLEETINANLLLHVVDVVDVLQERQIDDVNKVLREINADKIPQLIVYNKIDLKFGVMPKINYTSDGEPDSVNISASNDIGLDLLKIAILEKISWIAGKDDMKQELIYEPWKQ